MNEELERIVQAMMDNGESEDAIRSVILEYEKQTPIDVEKKNQIGITDSALESDSMATPQPTVGVGGEITIQSNRQKVRELIVTQDADKEAYHKKIEELKSGEDYGFWENVSGSIEAAANYISTGLPIPKSFYIEKERAKEVAELEKDPEYQIAQYGKQRVKDFLQDLSEEERDIIRQEIAIELKETPLAPDEEVAIEDIKAINSRIESIGNEIDNINERIKAGELSPEDDNVIQLFEDRKAEYDALRYESEQISTDFEERAKEYYTTEEEAKIANMVYTVPEKVQKLAGISIAQMYNGIKSGAARMVLSDELAPKESKETAQKLLQQTKEIDTGINEQREKLATIKTEDVDWGNVVEFAVESTAEQAANVLALSATGGTVGMGMIGVSVYGNTATSLEKARDLGLNNYTDEEIDSTAKAYAIFEGLAERIGTGSIIGKGKRVIQAAIKKEGVDFVKNKFINSVANVVKETTKGGITEMSEEAATQLASNLWDRNYLNEDKNILDGMHEAIAKGGASGLTMSGAPVITAEIIKQFSTKQNVDDFNNKREKINAIHEELSKGELDDNTIKALTKEVAILEEDLKKHKDKAIENAIVLTEDNYKNILQINTDIEQIDKAMEEVESEDVRLSLEERRNELEVEKQQIIDQSYAKEITEVREEVTPTEQIERKRMGDMREIDRAEALQTKTQEIESEIEILLEDPTAKNLAKVIELETQLDVINEEANKIYNKENVALEDNINAIESELNPLYEDPTGKNLQRISELEIQLDDLYEQREYKMEDALARSEKGEVVEYVPKKEEAKIEEEVWVPERIAYEAKDIPETYEGKGYTFKDGKFYKPDGKEYKKPTKRVLKDFFLNVVSKSEPEYVEQFANEFISDTGIEESGADINTAIKGMKVTPESFYKEGDRNLETSKMKRMFFDQKGQNIDQVREALESELGREVTIQEVVDAIVNVSGKVDPKREFARTHGFMPDIETMEMALDKVREVAGENLTKAEQEAYNEILNKRYETEQEYEKALNDVEKKAVINEAPVEKKSTKEKVEPTVIEKTIEEKAKDFANRLRKIKMPKFDFEEGSLQMSPIPVIRLAWNNTVEAAALSIEAGGSFAMSINKGIKNLKESDWYKGLNKKAKKEVVDKFTHELNKQFRTVRPKTIEKKAEKAGVKKSIAKQKVKELLSEEAIKKEIDALKAKKVNSKTVAKLVKQAKKADTPAKVWAFREAVEKLNKDAEYFEKVDKVRKLQKKIKGLSNTLKSGIKSDAINKVLQRLSANVSIKLKTEVIDKIININPNSVSNIDDYISLLTDVVESTRKPTVGETGVKPMNRALLSDMVDATNKLITDVHGNNIARLIAKKKAEGETLTIDEAIAFLENTGIEEDLEGKARKKEFNRKELTKYVDDQQAEYKGDISSRDLNEIEKEIADILLNADLSKVSTRNLRTLSLMLDNIYLNNDFSGTGQFSAYIKVGNNIAALNDLGVQSDPNASSKIAKFVGSFAVDENFFNLVFPNKKDLNHFKRYSGYQDYIQALIKSESIKNEAFEFLKEKAKQIKNINEILENGYASLLSHIMLPPKGFKGDNKNWVAVAKRNMLLSFASLTELRYTEGATNKETKTLIDKLNKEVAKGELTPEAFELILELNKIFKADKKKLYKKENKEVYEEMLNIYEEFLTDIKDLETSEDILSFIKKKLPEAVKIVYTTAEMHQMNIDDKIEYTNIFKNEIIENNGMYNSLVVKGKNIKQPDASEISKSNVNDMLQENITPTKAGGLMSRNKSGTINNGQYISLDFVSDQYNSFSSVAEEVYTAPHIGIIAGFVDRGVKTPSSEIILKNETRKVVEDFFVSKFERQMERNHIGLPNSVNKALRNLGGVSVRLVLGGIAQYVKQAAVLTHTFVSEPAIWMKQIGKKTTQPQQDLLKQTSVGFRDVDKQYISKTYTRGLDPKKLVTSRVKNIAEKLYDAPIYPLKHMDKIAAQKSWLIFYEAYLRNQGVTGEIDWSKEAKNPNKDAIAHAETLVNKNQNASVEEQMGRFWKNKNAKEIANIVAPLIRFPLNLTTTTWIDIRNIAFKGGKSRTESAQNLLANISQLAVYHGMLTGINYATTISVGAILNAFGVGADEEDEKLMVDFLWKRYKSNVLKDIFFGGIDPLGNAALNIGNRIAYGLTIDEQKRLYDSFEEYDRISNESEKMPFWFYENNDKNILDMAGLYGIALTKTWTAGEMATKALNGTYEKKYNSGKTKKIILSDESRKTFGLLSAITLFAPDQILQKMAKKSYTTISTYEEGFSKDIRLSKNKIFDEEEFSEFTNKVIYHLQKSVVDLGDGVLHIKPEVEQEIDNALNEIFKNQQVLTIKNQNILIDRHFGEIDKIIKMLNKSDFSSKDIKNINKLTKE